MTIWVNCTKTGGKGSDLLIYKKKKKNTNTNTNTRI